MPEYGDYENISYFSLPSGVSNVKRVDFFFNETPYASGYGAQIATRPVSQETITLQPGQNTSELGINRFSSYFGVASDGRPYARVYSSNSGSRLNWNIALTFYM